MPGEQRVRVTAQFMAAIPVAGVVSGVLAAPLLALDGRLGLAGWQWLFLVEGLPAVLLGIVAYSGLTNEPAHAGWLRPEERTWLVERLGRVREEGTSLRSHSGGLRDAVAVVGMLINSAASDRRQERRLHIAVPVLLTALGWFLCAGLDSLGTAPTVFGLTLSRSA